MVQKVNKNIVIFSLVWKLLERVGTQGIQFLVQIVLARLLYPEEYGTIAIVMVFINVANILVQTGFNTALIQKKDVDNLDFSSILYFSILLSTILYIILFIISPVIASFYRMPDLEMVIKILSTTLFFGAFNSVQIAFISRNFLFKKLFFSSLCSILISGFVGIFLAFKGYGVWALVAQQLISIMSISMILWVTVRWRPQIAFSISRVKVLISYGWKLLVSGLIDTLYRNLRTLLVGKIYPSNILGYYNRGEQFPVLIVSNINGAIQSVMLPTLSQHQEDRIRVKQIVRISILTSSYIIFPMMVVLTIVAEPLVIIVLTEKWLMAVPFLQIFSIAYMFMPIHSANLQAINAVGRSDLYLKLEIIKKTVGVFLILATISFGIYALAIGVIIGSVISVFINSYPNKHLFNYGYKEQIRDVLPIMLISVIMGAIVYSVSFFTINIYIQLLLQLILGLLSYIALSILFNLESYGYIRDTMKTLFNLRKDAQ